MAVAASNSSGELFIGVTHWDNGSYDVAYDSGGDPEASGDIQVDVFTELITEETADFFTFSGLTAGEEYFATTSGDADTILGLFDASGSLVDFSDDADGLGLLSQITFTADATGSATFAVSGFEGFGDQDFSGGYGTFGTYQLSITAVPEPSSLAILSLVGFVCCGIRRRK